MHWAYGITVYILCMRVWSLAIKSFTHTTFTAKAIELPLNVVLIVASGVRACLPPPPSAQ